MHCSVTCLSKARLLDTHKLRYPLWGEVNFTDPDTYWCTQRVKEAIPIRLYPDNFNGDSGIKNNSRNVDAQEQTT